MKRTAVTHVILAVVVWAADVVSSDDVTTTSFVDLQNQVTQLTAQVCRQKTTFMYLITLHRSISIYLCIYLT